MEESSHERCLGVHISNVLGGWGYSIDKGNKSILSKCGRRLYTLQKLGKYISFKRRPHCTRYLLMGSVFQN